MIRKLSLIFLVVTIGLVLFPADANTWGFFAHKRINRMAVFTLPPELFSFYKKHIEFVTEHAVDPDKRRYAVEGEAPKHYIDIDVYATMGEDPFKVVPRTWEDAVAKFTEDTLMAYGIVPWHIAKTVKSLTYAFKDLDVDRILRYSSDLGHYTGDAHVPLHTTENYNGQLTNQKGIHGFWESRLPELTAEDFDYLVGRATYLESPLDAAWIAVKTSHAALDSVLGFEKQLNATFPQDRKYSYESRGQSTMKVYSEEYSMAYNELLGDMVERRMRASIVTVGSFWYTAWVNAGQPDLSVLENKDISDSLKLVQKEEDRLYREGKIKGREHDD